MCDVCTAAEIKSWSRQLPNCLCLCVVMQTDNDVTVTSREFARHFRHVTTRTDNFCFGYVVRATEWTADYDSSWSMYSLYVMNYVTLVHCPCVLTNRRSGGGFNRGLRVRDSSVVTCVQEAAALTYFYGKRKLLANGPSTAPHKV